MKETKKNFFGRLESYFNNILYKQIGVAKSMGSMLGNLAAKLFFAYHDRNWLDPSEYTPLCYQWCVDVIFVFFKSSHYLKQLQNLN